MGAQADMTKVNQLIAAWRRGWFRTPQDLKRFSGDEIRSASNVVFGPAGMNVPNPVALGEAFVMIGRAKYTPFSDEQKEWSYLQDLVSKHVWALGQQAVPMRIKPIPYRSEVVDCLERLDPDYVQARLTATKKLYEHTPMLRRNLPSGFEEYPGNVYLDQDPVANSALSLTTFFAVMAARVLRDKTVNARKKPYPPVSAFDPRIVIADAARWAAVSPLLQADYQEDPLWPLLGLYAVGYWPFGKIKSGPKLFKGLKTDFIVFRMPPEESGVLQDGLFGI
jgi:hypothetical protein